jgi:hypothetical protein
LSRFATSHVITRGCEVQWVANRIDVTAQLIIAWIDLRVAGAGPIMPLPEVVQ